MWWYNILGDNMEAYHIFYGLILLLQGLFYSVLKIVALKRENYEPILTVKINEWRKLIDYFGLKIETDSSRVGKKKIYIFHIGYIPRPSYVNIHISRHHLDKYFNL